LQYQIESRGVRFSFTLPAGSYATVLLREVMKVDQLETGESSAATDPI
jgi:tRNA(Glu) U13 pseudouridine synthase TruD